MLPMAYTNMKAVFEVFKKDNQALGDLIQSVDSYIFACTDNFEKELWKTLRTKLNLQIMLNGERDENLSRN